MAATAVLLVNLGGPREQAEMEPFLEAIFADPEVLRLPFGRRFQSWFARFLARRRAPRAWRNYEAIGGSPLHVWTRLQAEGLRLGLAEYLPEGEVLVLPAMRYGRPSLAEALERAVEAGARRLLFLPLFPQYCEATTGSAQRALERLLAGRPGAPELVRVRSYAAHPGFLDCLAWRLGRTLRRIPAAERDGTYVLYTAHGLPEALVRAGDPYPAEVEATVAGVEARAAHGLPSGLAWQSRVGPVRWLRPYLDREVRRLGQRGVESLVVVPVSFVSEHVETLFELDREIRAVAEEAGIRRFLRVPAPNADPDFLAVLTELARDALGLEPQRAPPGARARRAGGRGGPR